MKIVRCFLVGMLLAASLQPGIASTADESSEVYRFVRLLGIDETAERAHAAARPMLEAAIAEGKVRKEFVDCLYSEVYSGERFKRELRRAAAAHFDDAAALRALNDSLETSGLSKLMDYSIARVWDATVPAPEFTPAEVEQLNKLGESKAGLAFVAFFRGPYVDVVKGIHNGGASAVMVEECKRR